VGIRYPQNGVREGWLFYIGATEAGTDIGSSPDFSSLDKGRLGGVFFSETWR